MKNKGLYIHVPFCKSKCLYCDFYSGTRISGSIIQDYKSAVLRNIPEETVGSAYFGGGTPSIMPAEFFGCVLRRCNIAENAEITVECNPGTVNGGYFISLMSEGVNRVSIGIQSFNSGELSRLGRIHSPEEAKRAVYDAYEAGFRNISADIMLGIPGQTLKTLDSTLNMLSGLPLSHISAYMLKLEKNTPLYNQSPELLDDGFLAELYLHTAVFLSENGFFQYEISNFAKTGSECRHNLNYWRCGEYYGIGPSAHSFTGGVRYACGKDLSAFIASDVQENKITDPDCGGFEERAMLALRLVGDGFDLSEYPSEREKMLKKAALLAKAGFLNINGDKISLTPEGCLVSNRIIYELIIR